MMTMHLVLVLLPLRRPGMHVNIPNMRAMSVSLYKLVCYSKLVNVLSTLANYELSSSICRVRKMLYKKKICLHNW